ncbi:MAG: tetratricopeptide repeat protein [Candidatus Mcinerneyibacterium aminivorans]|uniref:Tetratricopeptide repeat protein n=1 Tax=Candidatus Mcinerneyibacterium aminivorans TaxID=2703815 RepID=A0A5D0MKH2_9BACT|nr:MAG: tetratricopeptide repeat protein [Candidatus Mcinerneyibacterium aminivorans]
MANTNKQLLRASKYIQKEQFKKAIQIYKNLLSSMGNDPKILNKLGDTYLKMGKIDRAMEVFQNVADYYEKKGFFQNAIAIYKKMLREKNDVSLKMNIADLYVKIGSESEAEYYYNEYSEYYMRNENIQKAIPAYEKIVDINPDNMELKRKLAGLYHYIEDYQKMLGIYQSIFYGLLNEDKKEELDDIFNNLTKSCKDNDLLDNDIYFNIFNDYIDYLYKNEKKEAALNTAFDMATTLYENKNLKKSEKLLRKILEKNKEKIPARVKLIEIYKEQDKTDRLVEEYLSMAEYIKDDEPDRAEVIYQTVLKFDPENTTAKNFLKKKGSEKDDKDKIGVDLSEVEVSQSDKIKDRLNVDLDEVDSEGKGEEFKLEDGEIKEAGQQTSELESALQDIFKSYNKEINKNKSLLTGIEDKSSNLIPKIDDVITSFKKGIEDQLGGDPRNRYDMAIGFKEMGLIDSAIEEFRKLSLMDDYRIKSLNLLAQCLIEKEEYESAIEEFHEVLASEEITRDERDAIYYNIAVAYFKQQSFAQAYDYISQIENKEIFKKDKMYQKIILKLEETESVKTDDDDLEIEVEIEEESGILKADKSEKEKESKQDDYYSKSMNFQQNEKMQNQREEINSMKKEIKLLRKVLVALKDKYEQEVNNNDYTNKIKKLTKKVNRLERENSDLKDKIKNIESLKDTMNDIKEKFNGVEIELSELKEKVEDVDKYSHSLKQIGDFKDSLTNIEEITEKIRKVDSIEKELDKIENIKQRENDMLNYFMEYKEQIDQLSDKIKKLQKSRPEGLKDTVQSLKARIINLEGKFDDKLKDIEKDIKNAEVKKEKNESKEKKEEKQNKISFM